MKIWVAETHQCPKFLWCDLELHTSSYWDWELSLPKGPIAVSHVVAATSQSNLGTGHTCENVLTCKLLVQVHLLLSIHQTPACALPLSVGSCKVRWLCWKLDGKSNIYISKPIPYLFHKFRPSNLSRPLVDSGYLSIYRHLDHNFASIIGKNNQSIQDILAILFQSIHVINPILIYKLRLTQ